MGPVCPSIFLVSAVADFAVAKGTAPEVPVFHGGREWAPPGHFWQLESWLAAPGNPGSLCGCVFEF